GDGVRFTTAPGWLLRGARISQVHDDCVENDHMQPGTIIDSFFDGCYVFYSARSVPNADGSPGSVDHEHVVTIRHSLVHLAPMPSVYDGKDSPGHGPLFKMSARP